MCVCVLPFGEQIKCGEYGADFHFCCSEAAEAGEK